MGGIRFIKKVVIFALLACALSCGPGAGHSPALEGREALEFLRQQERFGQLTHFSNLGLHASALYEHVIEAEGLLYRFLWYAAPEIERKADDTARDMIERLRQIRPHMKNEPRLRVLLGNLETDATDYNAHFKKLTVLRRDFLAQYDIVVSPYEHILVDLLADLAVGEDDIKLRRALVDQAELLSATRAALVAFSREGYAMDALDAQRAAMYLHEFSQYMRDLEVSGKPELYKSLASAKQTTSDLLSAFDRMQKLGRGVNEHLLATERALSSMRKNAWELAGELQARRQAALQDYLRNDMQY